MSTRFRTGDVIRYRRPDAPQERTGVVIGHPHSAAEHDVVVIAPIGSADTPWEVLNDDWCAAGPGRNVGLARRERSRLRRMMPRGFMRSLQRGWTR